MARKRRTAEVLWRRPPAQISAGPRTLLLPRCFHGRDLGLGL